MSSDVICRPMLTVSSANVHSCHRQRCKKKDDVVLNSAVRKTTQPKNTRACGTGGPVGQVIHKHALRAKSCAATDGNSNSTQS